MKGIIFNNSSDCLHAGVQHTFCPATSKTAFGHLFGYIQLMESDLEMEYLMTCLPFTKICRLDLKIRTS